MKLHRTCLRYSGPDHLTKTASLVAAVLALAPGVAVAAQAPRVEITASRLPAIDGVAASPVQVVTREELLRSGAANVKEWLDNLPANNGGLSDLGGNGSFAGGASGASLRSMGKQGTLVLLNGRRLAPYPLADYNEVFTNLDTLPFEAIERIEVLMIGGAALYGSDAVAGVIHIITRAAFNGVQLRASGQRSLTSHRFGNRSAALTAGMALPGSQGGHLLANVSVYERDAVAWRELMPYVRPEAQQLSPSMGSFSSYSFPGNRIGVGPLSGCAPENLSNGLCMYDRFTRFEVTPAGQRANGLVSATLPLSQGREGFAEALLARNQTQYLSPFQPYGPRLGSVTWGNPSTNQAQTFWYRGLPAGHPLNPTAGELELRYRFLDAPSGTDVASTQYRLLAGVRGPWSSAGLKWDMEVAAGLMGGRSRMDTRGWYSLSGFHEVIGQDNPALADPLFFQRSYQLGQVNSAAVVNRLFPSYGYSASTRQAFADLKASADVARLPHGPVSVVVGAEVKHERHTIDPDALLRSGDIVGNGLSASDGSRWVLAAFGEATLPVAKGLQAQAAARIDKFGDASAHLSPKLALRWVPDPRFALRATVEGGFRAPNLTESATSTKFAFDNGVPDPRRCPQASALAKDLRAQAAALGAADPARTLLIARADSVLNSECSAAVASIVAHNPTLKPETSLGANLGLVFAPSRDLRLSADAWMLQRKDEIGLRSTRELIDAESSLPAGTVARLPLANDRSFSAAEQASYGVAAGALSSTTARFENTFRTRNHGIDLGLATTLGTPLGPLALKADAVYQADIRFWSNERNNWGDNLAGRGGYPRWKLTSAATLRMGHFEHGLRAVTTSRTSLQGDYFDTTYTPEGCTANGYTAGQCKQAGWTRWDYSLAYSGFKGVALSAQVHNLLRSLAPIGVASWLNGGGILPPTSEDARGRLLRVNLEVHW